MKKISTVSAGRKGFTLVELLVVIAIIGMLSTLAVVALGSARSKARDARRISDIKQIQTGLELYYADKTLYPTASPAIELGDNTHQVLCDTAAGFQADTTGCGTVYMGQVPQNFATPATTGYDYLSADGTTYVIDFQLEGEVSGLSGSLDATPSGIEASS